MLAVSVDRMQQEGIKGQWDTINQPDRKWLQHISYLTITKFLVTITPKESLKGKCGNKLMHSQGMTRKM